MGLAFLITTDNLQLLSERKVLKEAEYAALLDATQVVEAARREARRIVAQAGQDAEQARRSGHEEGIARAQAEYAQRLLSQAAAAEQQLRAMRRQMADIVAKAVGQLIAGASPEALFEAALQRVDALIRAEPFISIRVAPAQEPGLRSAIERLRSDAAWTANVSVQPDASLRDGACVLQTGSGTLEIGVDAQIEAFRRAVEGGVGGMAGSA